MGSTEDWATTTGTSRRCLRVPVVVVAAQPRSERGGDKERIAFRAAVAALSTTDRSKILGMLGHRNNNQRKGGGGGAVSVVSSFRHNVKPIMDLSELRMSRDTDQQSIIWNEITASRRKLEEENQLLRDKLHEAQMANRLLRLKLKQQQASGGGKGIGNAVNVERELKMIARETGALSKVFPRHSRKDAFRNPAAPGKKRFEVAVSAPRPPEPSYKNRHNHSSHHSADVKSLPTSGSDETPPTVISFPVASPAQEVKSRELVAIVPVSAPPARATQPTRRRSPLALSSIRRQQTTESASTVPHTNSATAGPPRGRPGGGNLPLLCQGYDHTSLGREKPPALGSENETGSPQQSGMTPSSSILERLAETRLCSDDDELALDYVMDGDDENNYNYLPPSVVAPPLGEEASSAWDPSDDHYRDWYPGDE